MNGKDEEPKKERVAGFGVIEPKHEMFEKYPQHQGYTKHPVELRKVKVEKDEGPQFRNREVELQLPGEEKPIIITIRESDRVIQKRAAEKEILRRKKTREGLFFLDQMNPLQVMEAYLKHALMIGGRRDQPSLKDVIRAYMADYEDREDLETFRDGIALGVYLSTVMSQGLLREPKHEIENDVGTGSHHPRSTVRCHGKFDDPFEELGGEL